MRIGTVTALAAGVAVAGGLRAVRLSVQATPAEQAGALPGDDVVPAPLVVLDTATTLPGTPEAVWPWLLQLGKRRAGWYLPHAADVFVPRRRRALRHVDPALQGLRAGDTIPDWGPDDPTFEAVLVEPPHTLVYRSERGPAVFSWVLQLADTGSGSSRLRLRLRVGGEVRHPRLVATVGSRVDQLTVALLFAGLAERVADTPSGHVG